MWYIIETYDSNSGATGLVKSIVGRTKEGTPRFPEYECKTRTAVEDKKVRVYARYMAPEAPAPASAAAPAPAPEPVPAPVVEAPVATVEVTTVTPDPEFALAAQMDRQTGFTE